MSNPFSPVPRRHNALSVPRRYNGLLAPLLISALLGMANTVHAANPSSVEVTSCGITFELPSGYRISKPQRDENCRIEIEEPLKIQRACRESVRSDLEEHLDVEDSDKLVLVVAQGAIDRPVEDMQVGAFDVREGKWLAGNALNFGDIPEQVMIAGKKALKGQYTVRAYEKGKNVYRGAYGVDIWLLQLEPDLLVAVQNEPIDNVKQCASSGRFLKSLRVAKKLPPKSGPKN